MSRLILFNLFFVAILFSANAQENNDVKLISDSDYETLIENSFKVDFRAYAFEKLDLNSEQIRKLTPIYMAYMSDKYDLIDRRRVLIDRYGAEMAEDDTRKDERNETAEFIEDYWELDIAEMELRKDYFDRFEDRIPYEKAVEFFLLEEDVRQRLNRIDIVETVPVLMIEPSYAFSLNPEVINYNNWAMDLDGKVSLSHSYTNQGLNQLAKTLKSMAFAANLDTEMVETMQQEIMALGEDITKDWTATDHADKTRKAFKTLSNMFYALEAQPPFAGNDRAIKAVKTAALQIDPNKLLTNQSEEIYNFFEQAQNAVNVLARRADLTWKQEWRNARRR